MKSIFLLIFTISFIYADYIDDESFKEINLPILTDTSVNTNNRQNSLSGKLNIQSIYNHNHDNLTSLQGSIFLDYTNTIKEDWRFKINGKYYYDGVYDIRSSNKFSDQEKNEFRNDAELHEAYIEGKIVKNLDVRLGRQIVAWGNSDSLRIVDVLNPLDNRRPGLTDIENIRLPVNMIKFDYFIDDLNIEPILILEQRISKLPPIGTPFNPMNFEIQHEKYNDITYGLKVSKNFYGGEANFYTAKIYDDQGYIVYTPMPINKHEKINMVGTSESFTWGSWLFKNENAYLDELLYTSVKNKTFKRLDILLGFEYYGFSDMTLSYDFAVRTNMNYDPRLLNEINPIYKKVYENALRISKSFMHDTINLNYLLSTQGNKIFTKLGGLQRFWIEHKFNDSIKMEVGVVDYIGGSSFYNNIKNQDSTYFNISYNF